MWDSIIGHQQAITYLRRVTRSERVGHAYLFIGPSGVGKQTVSKAFSCAILCHNQDAPCGNCESCKLFAAGAHPDYAELYPAAQSFRIAQIRELNLACYMRPSISKRRVYILHNVEKLTSDAANSFLRTLEEPPEYVTFVLLADTSDILSTIVSRCQVLYFAALTQAETLKVVSSAANKYSQADIERAVRISLGSPGQALALLDKNREALALAEEIADKWLIASTLDKLAWQRTLEDKREELPLIVEYLSLRVRDVMLFKLGLANLTTAKDVDLNTAAKVSAEELLAKWQALFDLQAKLYSNVNRKLVVDELLLVM